MHWPREKRAKIVLCLCLAGFAFLFGRLVFLQVIKASYYQKIAEDNRIRRIPQPAPRGIIFDRQGKIMVDNRPSFTVALIPYELRGQDQVIPAVAKILGSDSSWLREKIENPRYSVFEPVPVKRDADFSVVSQIAEESENLPGVVFQAEPTRKYPLAFGTSQLLGYVSEISEEELRNSQKEGPPKGINVGKMGIEKEYDDLLRGRDGADFYEVTARGRVIGKLPDKENQARLAGLDLVLTVDLELQHVAESLLSQYSRGSIVALDPHSGEILCLVNQPGFDANSFASVLSPEDWLDLTQDPDLPLLNRVTQSAYPPGSTLKLLVAGAALETGLITPSTTFRPCNGGFQWGERYFHCWDPHGHGTLDLKGAIINSCDTYFYQLGLKAGIDLIAEYADKCGFGKKLGVDLPDESRGFVPTTNFYDRRYGQKGWTKSVVLNLAIGQGEFLVTPLQIASFYAALSNDGKMYQPHLLRRVIFKNGEVLEYEKTVLRNLPFSKPTLDFLKEACLEAVNSEKGTGRAAMLPDLAVAGKTGSAQNPHGNTHSWFVGFAPVQDPKIVVAVLVENAGHGGDVSAPLAKQIISAYLQPQAQLAQSPVQQ